MPLPLIPLAISGISALGGLLGNRGQTQQMNSVSNSNSGSTTMPSLSAEGTGVLYPLADKYLEFLSKDPNLTSYRNAQAGDINRLADIKKKNIAETMAARGVSGPAVSTALNSSEGSRIGDLTHLDQSIPLLADQLFSNKIAQGTDLFRSIPEGTSTTSFGNTISQGTQTDPGNMLGGLFGNLSGVLAYLYGRGAFGGGGGTSTSNQGNV